MKLVAKVILIFLLISTVECFEDEIHCKNNRTILSRSRRYLDFLEQTRVFFRVNYKVNVVTWGAIWAHASGWKANMNLMNENKALRPFRRDTYEMLRKLLTYQGLDGEACVLKAFCTATRKPDGEMANGMLFKLLRHLFTHGFDGQACVLKAFCVASRDADKSLSNGVLYKLLRHIFELNENDRRHFSYLKDENCDQILHHHCPLSFNSISPFTDDI